ncbi:uncharacterized protein LOC144628452 [Oculina patagonica]
MNFTLSFMLLVTWFVCVTAYRIQKDTGFTCKTQMDCSKDECCAFLQSKAVKVCRKIRLYGAICNPYEIPGLPEKCLCQQGLTCTPMDNTTRVFRCLDIPTNPSDLEYEEVNAIDAPRKRGQGEED